MTEHGTFLVAHMDLGKVAEYDGKGKEVWSVDVFAVVGIAAAGRQHAHHQQ